MSLTISQILYKAAISTLAVQNATSLAELRLSNAAFEHDLKDSGGSYEFDRVLAVFDQTLTVGALGHRGEY